MQKKGITRFMDYQAHKGISGTRLPEETKEERYKRQAAEREDNWRADDQLVEDAKGNDARAKAARRRLARATQQSWEVLSKKK